MHIFDRGDIRMTSCKPTSKEEHLRKPEWLKIKLNTNDEYKGLKKLMREKNLHTVCEDTAVQISMNVGEKDELLL